MTEKMILTAGPSITERELAYVTDAVKHGWNNDWNGYILRLEAAFRDFHSMSHAMATAHCTGAMHIALLTLGIGPGDEVIVPDITWVSTAAVVAYVGATPVFCDIESDSWNMCPRSLEDRITPRTKAIMPVHMYGQPANMPEIMPIAKKHGLWVVEDAAPSLGAEIGGQRVGSFGDFSAYSFQGAKLAVGGEGGMLLIRDPAHYSLARQNNRMGLDHERALWSVKIGYKYHMSNIQAALILAQFERLEELIERKRAINARYFKNLNGNPYVKVTGDLPNRRSVHWMTSIEVQDCDNDRRQSIMAALKKANIDTRPVFYPLSSMPMFKRTENPVAYRVGHAGINLPSGHNLTDAEIDYVSEKVLDICGS